MERDLLASFGPDGDALHRRIATHIDDAMLEHIAKGDSGMSFDAHLRELRKIRDHGIIEDPLEWEPREALNMTRWSEPDDPDLPAYELAGRRGHWVRAFCCAVLLRALGDAETRAFESGGYSVSVILMIESLRRLDAGLEREAMAALAWFILRLRESSEEGVEDEIAFAGAGLLALAVRSEVPDRSLLEVAHWLLGQEQRAFDAWGRDIGDHPGHWLLRTSHLMKAEKWIALGEELALFGRGGECGELVRNIGARLSGRHPP